jgi:hypothetical protein
VFSVLCGGITSRFSDLLSYLGVLSQLCVCGLLWQSLDHLQPDVVYFRLGILSVCGPFGSEHAKVHPASQKSQEEPRIDVSKCLSGG